MIKRSGILGLVAVLVCTTTPYFFAQTKARSLDSATLHGDEVIQTSIGPIDKVTIDLGKMQKADADKALQLEKAADNAIND